MIRATTPKHIFEFDVNAEEFENILITYKQCGRNILNFEKNEIELNGKTATVTLSETQTKEFRADHPLYVQVRVLLNGEVMASDIIRLNVSDVLNDIIIGG